MGLAGDRQAAAFLKKAAQKLLFAWVRGDEASTAQIKKVFLLLFVHKKKPSSWLGHDLSSPHHAPRLR
jgi:hypothetical protein